MDKQILLIELVVVVGSIWWLIEAVPQGHIKEAMVPCVLLLYIIIGAVQGKKS